MIHHIYYEKLILSIVLIIFANYVVIYSLNNPSSRGSLFFACVLNIILISIAHKFIDYGNIQEYMSDVNITPLNDDEDVQNLASVYYNGKLIVNELEVSRSAKINDVLKVNGGIDIDSVKLSQGGNPDALKIQNDSGYLFVGRDNNYDSTAAQRQANFFNSR